ncbi:unnamed protein product [Cunninghamella blakesleeana]
MKAQVLLLGEYDSSSLFKLYLIPSQEKHAMDYICIEDLYYLFFQHSDKQIYPLFQQLYQLYPHHFYIDHQLKKGYIAKHHVLTIAKSLQLLALAEFCTLSHDELLNNVADPLFAITNALLLRPVPPKYMDIFLDWAPMDASSSYFYSPFSNNNNNNNNNAAATLSFISDLPLSSKQQQIQNNKDTTTTNTNINNTNTNTNNNHHQHQHHHNNNNHTIINTITNNNNNNNNIINHKNDASWTCHFLPIPSHLLKRTLQAQKQQHAIIECRQRQLVYRQSHQHHHQLLSNPLPSKINPPLTHRSQQQQPIIERKRKKSSPPLCSPPPSSVSCSSSSSISSSSTITTIHQQQLSSLSSTSSNYPPLPPPLIINTNTNNNNNNNNKIKEEENHHLLKKQKLLSSSYNNNLDLLATQATKMKGLPLSPEISPQPPVLSLPPISSNVSFHSSPLIQSISLPSLRNVLSDI